MDVASWLTLRNTSIYITNSLSILGCLILFCWSLRAKHSKTVAMKLILLLNFSDMLASLINIISYSFSITDQQCQVVSFIRSFTIWCGLFWTSALSLLTYLTLKDPKRPGVNRLFSRIIAVCVVMAVIIASLYC